MVKIGSGSEINKISNIFLCNLECIGMLDEIRTSFGAMKMRQKSSPRLWEVWEETIHQPSHLNGSTLHGVGDTLGNTLSRINTAEVACPKHSCVF